MTKNKIGLTFGVFDLFHIGHLNLLINAKKYCDKLIVCISTDEYCLNVKKYKPVIKFSDRMRIVNAIEYVNDIEIQDIGYSKKDAIEEYNPDILFVGGDWDKKTYSGEGLGVEVKYLPYTKIISTTLIKKKL